MKRVLATIMTGLLAMAGSEGVAAGGTSFALGATVPARCSIEAAETRTVSPDLQLVTVSANCNLERFAIRIAGLDGLGGIVRAEAAQGDVRINVKDRVDVRASRPGRHVVRVWVPAGAAEAIMTELIA